MVTKDNKALFDKATAQLEARKIDDAAKNFARLVNSEPGNAEYRAWYAHALARQGNAERALEEADRAVALDPNLLLTYRVRSIIFFGYGQFENALADLDQMVALEPENYETFVLRADYFNQRGDKTRALEASVAAFEYSSLENGTAWTNTSTIIASIIENNHEYQQTVEELGQQIELEPLNALPFRVRADLHKAKGNCMLAVEDYSRAIELDPSVSKYALWERALCYDALERYEEALIDRTRFFAIKPKLPYEADNDDEYEALCSTVHEHFQNVLQPFLDRDGEHLIDYWICYFLFDYHRSEFSNRVLGAVTKNTGKYGTGYVCLTDKKTIITTFKQFADLSPHATDYGFSMAFMKLIVGKFISDFEPAGDHMWRIANDEISKVHCSEVDILDFESAVVNCRITSHPNTFNHVLAGLRMAMKGSLAALWDEEPAAGIAGKAETLQLLEKLGSLRSAGIVTEAEFEEKKAKLIAHL